MWAPRRIADGWFSGDHGRDRLWSLGAFVLIALVLMSLSSIRPTAEKPVEPADNASTEVVEELPELAPPPPVIATRHEEPPLTELMIPPTSVQILSSAMIGEGRTMLVVARVTSDLGEPLADVPVEWTIDTQGVGQIVGVSQSTVPGNPGERILPTFARTYTAPESYSLQGGTLAFDRADIGKGDAWCLVHSNAAGEMVLTAVVPGIASTDKRRVTVRHLWKIPTATFPLSLEAISGSEVMATTKVISEDGSPAHGFLVRYSMPDAGDVVFANGERSMDVLTDSRGDATARLKQGSPGARTTRVLVELMGRPAVFDGPPPALSKGEFEIQWIDPAFQILAEATSPVRVEDRVEVRVLATSREVPLTSHFQLVALIPPDLEINGVTTAGEMELGRADAKGELSRQFYLRADRPGKRQVRFELREDARVLAIGKVEIEFAVPVIRIEKRLPENWRVGQKAAYQLVMVNDGPVLADHLRLVHDAPQGLRAESQGALRFADRLEWEIDLLESGATRTFDVHAVPEQVFDRLALRTRVERQGRSLAETAGVLSAEGMAALRLSIRDLADPVPVGGTVEYLVLLENHGTAAANGIELEATVPPEIEWKDAAGLLPTRITSKGLLLGPVPILSPGQSVQCHLRAKAARAGEARFSVRLKHPSVGPEGTIDQESTVLFAKEE